MAIEIISIDNVPNWINGTVDGYIFEAKHYDEGSRFGIDGGRISKLTITNDEKEIAHYDRGWDREPKTIEHIEILTEVVDYLERLPKRFENEIEIIL